MIVAFTPQVLQKKKKLEDKLEELQHTTEKRSKELKRMAARQAFSKAANGTHPQTMPKGSKAMGHHHGEDMGTEVSPEESMVGQIFKIICTPRSSARTAHGTSTPFCSAVCLASNAVPRPINISIAYYCTSSSGKEARTKHHAPEESLGIDIDSQHREKDALPSRRTRSPVQ